MKFLLRATNQHGVHSPFVYNLVTQCFYDKTYHPAYKKISAYRNGLLGSTFKINIQDLGTGSKTNKSSVRNVSSIAKHAGASYSRSKLMYRTVAYLHSSNILELGTSLGIATHAMHLGNPQASIATIEGCPHISAFTKAYFNKHQVKNVSVINKDFKTALTHVPFRSLDLVFFDGNHQNEPTLEYFNTLLTRAHNDTVFIFDDIYWSKEMTKAWDTIKQHPKVTVTIDTFFWGLVFFRKEQHKEHFKIRV